ncbi:MAG: hypothetical protein V1492_05375 [Candidatus Micrarchaeota archaeon]
MQEIECESVEVIKSAPFYPDLALSIKKQRDSLFMQSIVSLIFLIGISWVLIPYFLYVGYSIFSSIVSLFSPTTWTNFDLTQSILSVFISFFMDLIYAIPLILFIIIAIWFWNSLRMYLHPHPYMAKKILVVENYKEVEAATTKGLFSLVYSTLKQFFGRIGVNLDTISSPVYAKGAIIIRTPIANWPLVKSKGTDIFYSDFGDYFVIAYTIGNNLQAVAVVMKKHKETILKKLNEYFYIKSSI